MKTFNFSLVLCTRENTDVFISLDDNIYGIHSKRINILYLLTGMLFATNTSGFIETGISVCLTLNNLWYNSYIRY